MKTRNLLMACACAFFALAAQAQTQVISHRGFWKTEGSAQNFIAALNKAAEAKVYGSEFDVQLIADGVVVVNHDDSINGLVVGETVYDRLKDLKLKNGEKLPILADYLSAGKKLPDVQLILEIKPHKTKAQEEQIAESTVKMVKEYGMEKMIVLDVDYITTDQPLEASA